MTLPSSGAISINAINIELGRSGTAQSSLNETALRTLAGVPSGQIDFNDFWGKSSALTWTMTAGTSGSLTGYRFFQYGTTSPELPTVRNSGTLVGVNTDGTQLQLYIGGIGGAMVTQTNVFTDFVTNLIGTVTASGASNFTATGSAGNSSGYWYWNTTTKFVNASNYSQSLTLV